MARYKCTLSPELKAKATEELNEPKDDEQILAAIDKLRNAFKESNPDLKLLRDDDQFILRYLRAKKFDHGRALNVLTNYHLQRADWREAFDKIDNPILIKETIDSGAVCPLAGKDKYGCTIIVVRPGLQSNQRLIDMFAAIVMTMERLLEREEVQINGIITVTDFAYLSTDIAKQVTPFLAGRFSKTMQDCLPLRIKQLNATNQPKIFDMVFAIIQPFFNEKMKQRFVLHGGDFSKLYERIDRSVLPHMFAGSGPEMDIEGWKKLLLQEGTAL